MLKSPKNMFLRNEQHKNIANCVAFPIGGQIATLPYIERRRIPTEIRRAAETITNIYIKYGQMLPLTECDRGSKSSENLIKRRKKLKVFLKEKHAL
jgi:hypothetical protein